MSLSLRRRQPVDAQRIRRADGTGPQLGCGKDSWHVEVCHFPERVFFVKGLLVRFLGLWGLVFAYVDHKKSRRGFSKWAILYFLRT